MRLVRSAIFSLWFNIVSLTLVLLGLPLGVVAPRKMRAYAAFWAGAVLWGLKLFGARVVIEGRENLPTSGKALIASQHQSAFDTLLWFLLLPDCRYVVKIELMRLPLFGFIARASRQIGVDRAAGANAMRGLLREADIAWSQGAQVVIFPEGTRAAPGQVAPLHAGIAALARHSGLPVVPVTTDSGICWGKGFFGKRASVIHVRIHPSLPAGLKREALMTRLQELFENEAVTQIALPKPVDKSVHEASARF